MTISGTARMTIAAMPDDGLEALRTFFAEYHDPTGVASKFLAAIDEEIALREREP